MLPPTNHNKSHNIRKTNFRDKYVDIHKMTKETTFSLKTDQRSDKKSTSYNLNSTFIDSSIQKSKYAYQVEKSHEKYIMSLSECTPM